METHIHRSLRFEREVQEPAFVLSDAQIARLGRHSADFRCRFVESARPREHLNQDTFE